MIARDIGNELSFVIGKARHYTIKLSYNTSADVDQD